MSRNLDLSKSHPPNLSQSHQYDTVNISGSATAILGDVHHYHAPQSENVNPETQYLKSLLDQLAYSDMRSRFQTLNDPFPDTFRWILDLPGNHNENFGDTDGYSDYDDFCVSEQLSLEDSAVCWDSFVDWLEEGSIPYWISGKLGTGKSTLMKFIVDSLSSSHDGYGETVDTIIISHFFWEPGSELSNSVLGCLRTLLWQLLHFTESMCSKEQTASVANIGSTSHLRNDLIKTVGSFDKTVIVLLDGLDECRETDDVLDLLEALSALSNVKLCVSSRREEVYVLQFSEFAKLRLQDLNNQDIARYVRKELLENPRLRRSPSWRLNDAKDLARSIIANAEGVFLWVRLVIKDLLRGWTNRDDLIRMQKRLEKLPHDIYKLYTELIRRDPEDMTDYASDAAFYYQLLAQNSARRISLVSFSFAVNEVVRARYLELDTVFSLPLTDLECDVDLDTLITWINVRTAGLLEVKMDDDVFHYNNNIRPESPSKYAVFRRHWVGFIHRSAYTYLQDTSEGQNLVMKCPMTPDTLKNVYFESHVVAHLIVPGTHNLRFQSTRHGFGELFPSGVGMSSLTRQWCELLQLILDKLLAQELIITTRDWIVSSEIYQYPASAYQTVDLCMLFAVQGYEEISKTFLQQYKCEDDHQYMANLTISHIASHVHQDACNDVYMSFLLRKLQIHLQLSCSMETMQSKEEITFRTRLADMAASTQETERAVPIWKFLEANFKEVYPLSLPLSKGLINIYVLPGVEYSVSVVATLSVHTMMVWTQGRDLGPYSAGGRALFFQDYHCYQQSGMRYRIIDPTDSREVLERLRLMVLSRRKSEFTNQPNNYFWFHTPGAGFYLKGTRDVVLSQGLQQIFDRSLRCGSFVNCLRQIGKSEETIEYVVGEQVEITFHQYREFRYTNHFEELLGSDPKNLAPWIQKYPQLTEVFAQQPRQSGDEASVSEIDR